MARPAAYSVILGVRSMDQLTDNVAAAELKLTPEETQLLDEASEPPTHDYPYGEPGQPSAAAASREGEPECLAGTQGQLMQTWQHVDAGRRAGRRGRPQGVLGSGHRRLRRG